MGSKLLRWSVTWPAKFFSASWQLGMEDCPGPGGTILPSTCSTLNFQSKLSPKGWRRHKAESSQFGVFFYKTYIFENNESKVKPCHLNNSYNNGSQNSAKTHSRLNYHWWTVHGQEDVGLWVMQQALLSGHQDRQPPGQRFGLNLKKIDLFGLVSPVARTEIPLGAKNSTALRWQVWLKPYCARCPPKLLMQSRSYAGHIQHN